MEPAAERERASSQWLTHPRGKSIDLPHFRTHRSQITTASQRCLQHDKIVVVTQGGLQLLESRLAARVRCELSVGHSQYVSAGPNEARLSL